MYTVYPHSYEELADRIAAMTHKSRLYRVLRDAMKQRGNWRYRPRGKPSADNFRRSITS